MKKIMDILKIQSKLPEIISSIAGCYSINEYRENPDYFDPRLIKWHEFGLLTHTNKVLQAYNSEAFKFLDSWNLKKNILKYMNQSNTNFSKDDLFKISILFHDFGKIVSLNSMERDRKHELESSKLIDSSILKEKFDNIGLNSSQIDYIKRCIETHAILGKNLRDELSESGNLNLESLSSSNFKKFCKDTKSKYSDVYSELGIFFLCDCLGKTDYRGNYSSEKDIENYLHKRKLPYQLKSGIMQIPFNLKISENYLREVI